MARYEIAFSGELVPGAQLEAVQANLAKLFQACLLYTSDAADE